MKVGTSVVIGLVLSALGVATPIAWDWYKSRAALELQYLGSATLNPQFGNFEKIQIFYDGRAIKSLSRLEFAFVNSGRKPIVKDEIVNHPTISFSRKSKVLDVQIVDSNPEKLDMNYDISEGSRSVSFSFSLLNPSDFIRFAVLVSGNGNINSFETSARIVGVPRMELVRRVEEFEKKAKSIPWTVYPVGFFIGLMALFILFGLIPDLIREYTIKKQYQKNNLIPVAGEHPESYISFIDDRFRFRTRKERSRVKAFLRSLPNNEPISEKDYEKLRQEIHHLLFKENATRSAAILFFPIFAGGLYYLIITLL